MNPLELFSVLASRARSNQFILIDLNERLNETRDRIMKNGAENSDMLLGKIDLISSLSGGSESAQNARMARIMGLLEGLDFEIGKPGSGSDVLGESHEYLINAFIGSTGGLGD